LKVKLIDDTVKTVLVDDSLLVWEIVDTIGEKLNIKNAEEYSLARVDGSSWLHPNQPLVEQGIEEKDTLLLKKKFFVTDQSVDRGDPIQLHLVFIQCRDMIGMFLLQKHLV
jgi:talin